MPPPAAQPVSKLATRATPKTGDNLATEAVLNMIFPAGGLIGATIAIQNDLSRLGNVIGHFRGQRRQRYS
jgi:hypothetical protein